MRRSTVTVNGKPHPWHPGLTASDVVRQLGDPPAKVGTALNGQFLPRPLRENAPLRPGDTLVVFEAVVGG